ncbi:uncharacterized protein [Eurosta solidaginis]|uniref:uncharacterized protein n=1 Tax=Eurosta solidaginis TaxID=178769 RepID=UPI00353143C9
MCYGTNLRADKIFISNQLICQSKEAAFSNPFSVSCNYIHFFTNTIMEEIVITDTEAETTVELEESMFNKKVTNATRSIFNLTLNDGLEEKESHEVKSYEERLREEIKQWGSLWRESLQKLKDFKTKPHPQVDASILSAENRAYLKKAPDLRRFIRESIDFRQKAYIFLEKDYPDFQDVQQNLINACDYRICVSQTALINKNLANNDL